jgi:SAM-dependent methyltransferase
MENMEMTCPVCDSDAHRVIFADVQDPLTHDSFRILECSKCAVAYTAPRPANMERYYPIRYRAFGPVVRGVLGTLYKHRVSRWAGALPTTGSVLEIGCGAGMMLSAFQRLGWRVLGIERDERLAAEARDRQGVEVTALPLGELPDDLRFDIIVMFNVFEHIAEPMPILRECVRRLQPGGRLLLNMPNFGSWQARFAGRYWFHLDPPRHLIHYSRETLIRTLQRAGLQVIQTDYVSFEHDPYGWVESTINRITGRSNTITRFLMGIDPLSPQLVFSCLLAAALSFPAVLLAITSWIAQAGALIEVTAVAPGTDGVPARD